MRFTEHFSSEYKLASQDDRVINGVIDIFISSFIAFVLSSILYFFSKNYFISIAFFFKVRILYYCFFEYTTGQTIGKIFTKSMVVGSDGKEVNFSKIYLRNLIRIFTAILSALDDAPLAFHDKHSKTFVVKVSESKRHKLSYFIIFIIILIVTVLKFVFQLKNYFQF